MHRFLDFFIRRTQCYQDFAENLRELLNQVFCDLIFDGAELFRNGASRLTIGQRSPPLLLQSGPKPVLLHLADVPWVAYGMQHTAKHGDHIISAGIFFTGSSAKAPSQDGIKCESQLVSSCVTSE